MGYVGTGAMLWAVDELGGYIGRTPGGTPLVKAGTPVGGVWPGGGGAELAGLDAGKFVGGG